MYWGLLPLRAAIGAGDPQRHAGPERHNADLVEGEVAAGQQLLGQLAGIGHAVGLDHRAGQARHGAEDRVRVVDGQEGVRRDGRPVDLLGQLPVGEQAAAVGLDEVVDGEGDHGRAPRRPGYGCRPSRACGCCF
jgi:hypothetical protein